MNLLTLRLLLLKEPFQTPVNLVKLQDDASQLAELAKSLPADINQVNRGLLPKEVIEKLKRIEKLSKRLRNELEVGTRIQRLKNNVIVFSSRPILLSRYLATRFAENSGGNRSLIINIRGSFLLSLWSVMQPKSTQF